MHGGAMSMLRKYDEILRAHANTNASLEEQNQYLLEHISIIQQDNCALKLNNNKVRSNLAENRLNHPQPPEEKQAHIRPGQIDQIL
jgi:regulator of replication initiation timing